MIVNRLTPEQRAALEPCARGVLHEVVFGGPTDRTRVEAAVMRCHAIAEVPWPGSVTWAASPSQAWSQVMARIGPVQPATMPFVQAHARTLFRLRGVGDRPGLVDVVTYDGIAGMVRDLLAREAVLEIDHVESISGLPGYEHTRFSHGFPPDDPLFSSGFLQSVGGCYGIAEAAMTQACLVEVCGLRSDDDLWDFTSAQRSSGGARWWSFPDHVVICDRPVEIHRQSASDGRMALHADPGPSVRWADGMRVFHRHGVPLTAES